MNHPLAGSFRRLCVLAAVCIFTSPGRAVEVPLTIANPETAVMTGAPVTSGVPFAQGALPDASAVRLVSGSNEIPAQFLPTALWPDGSVRWLLCDFQTDIPTGRDAVLTLQTGTAAAPVAGIVVTDGSSSLSVNTGAATFSFDKSALAVRGYRFAAVWQGRTYIAMPTPGRWVVEENGPMKVVVRCDGAWSHSGTVLRDSRIGFRARLFFYRNRPEVRVAFTFRNNNSFGWDAGRGKRPDLVLSGLAFGPTVLLRPGGSFVFGSGVEKTFETVLSSAGAPAIRDTRYAANGTLASSRDPDRPLALASPAYYASTGAWGHIVPPVGGLPAARQADFDRFEKMQRAKVISSEVQNPPNMIGITAFAHLARDIDSWNNYGCLRWDGEQGPWSGNHYDWSHGMYLQAMRTGLLPFANLARVMARHEIDLDLYHTGYDGTGYNFQKNWETRPSHNNADNTFGGGRPTHTWTQGYALHWLLAGEPRGRDAYTELFEGIREYLYESFNDEGHVNTNEIRTQGWLVDNLVTLWRINPNATFRTTSYGVKTIPAAIKDVLRNVFEREAAAGQRGFVYAGNPDRPDVNTRHPLQNCYVIEPLAKAYEEVFAGRDDAYAAQLLALTQRMTRFLMSVTFGGDSYRSGLYRPRQIPEYMNTPSERTLGQIPYLLMAANGAGFCYLHGGGADFLTYMRSAFQDYCRYFSIVGEDGAYVNPALRMPACYNSSIYVGTESKVHGWSSRYGMYALAAEKAVQGVDNTLPVAVGFSPALSATGVSLGVNLCFVMNEPVVKGPAGNILLRRVGTGTAESLSIRSGNVTVYGNRVTISPVNRFVSGAVYSVEVQPGALTDAAGNPFAGIADDGTWRFGTGIFPSNTVAITDANPIISVGISPVFWWDAVPGAVGYELEVYSSDGRCVRRGSTAGHDATPPATHVRFQTVFESEGKYTWHVRARRADGSAGPWAGPGGFTVKRLDKGPFM